VGVQWFISCTRLEQNLALCQRGQAESLQKQVWTSQPEGLRKLQTASGLPALEQCNHYEYTQLLTLPCDVLIPAALENQITEECESDPSVHCGRGC